MTIVILGLSITSSWGNGHATTYRGLTAGLVQRGHRVLFLERDKPWYAANRDLPRPPSGRTELYSSLDDLERRFTTAVREADAVIIGSYVPEGIAVGDWVFATARGLVVFYDIDTPVTLAAIDCDRCTYISREQIPRYQLYLSFTGGPALELLERQYGTARAQVLYCSADPGLYSPDPAQPISWDLGYLGTYSEDRQPSIEKLIFSTARRWRTGRFVVAGPQYPASIHWPGNVDRIEHLAPGCHRAFYNAQRFTLNLTRADMRRAGWSPSVRLFEAAACGVPIISDSWAGLSEIFEPGRDILVADSAASLEGLLRETPEWIRRRIGARARERVLAEHTGLHRADQLENYIRTAAATSSTCASSISAYTGSESCSRAMASDSGKSPQP